MSWFCCFKKTKNKKQKTKLNNKVCFDNNIHQTLIGSFDSECTVDNNIIKADSNSVVVRSTSHYLPH